MAKLESDGTCDFRWRDARVEAPAAESANADDVELSDEIAWTMALEDRTLSTGGYDRLLDGPIDPDEGQYLRLELAGVYWRSEVFELGALNLAGARIWLTTRPATRDEFLT